MRPNTVTLPNLRRALKRFVTDARAATAIEYAMIAAGVAVAIVGAVDALGTTIKTTLYDKVGNALVSE